ncbi:MAG: hypothetical protein HQL72_09315 [Magnetococcales bacterium]|nr:hypothetical protein [Magnetococcales bacterium]
MEKKSEKTLTDRRQVLIRMLSLGLLAGTGPVLLSACGGAKPRYIEPGINEVEGRVLIDGKPAALGMKANPNSLIETGPDAMVALVLGLDAFLLRENTRLRFIPKSSTSLHQMVAETVRDQSTTTDTSQGPAVVVAQDVFGFSLESGKVLSVFSPGSRLLRTPSINIGIRGTGVYLESALKSDGEQSYICTCYGTVDIQSRVDPTIKETVVSKHHDAPRTITSFKNKSQIRLAPFTNHTDAELTMIEALVGRVPPFKVEAMRSHSMQQNRTMPRIQHVPTTTGTHSAPTSAPVSIPTHTPHYH